MTSIARKRKVRGKNQCIREATAVLRALQTKYDRLMQLRSDIDSLAPEVTNASRNETTPQLLTQLSTVHAVLCKPAELYRDSFVHSDAARFLVPFELTDSSSFVDCSMGFANLVSEERDQLITGMKVSDVLLRSSFMRLQQLEPFASQHGTIHLRNLPSYCLGTLSDVVVSVETEVVPVADPVATRCSDEAAHVKKRLVRRFLQVIVFNFRTLPTVSPMDVDSPAETTGLLPSRVDPDSISAISPQDSSTVYSAETDVVLMNDSRADGSEHTLDAPLPDVHTMPAVQCPAVFMVPAHARLDDPVANVGWVSPWSSDQLGAGVPGPWVPLNGTAARKLHKSFDLEDLTLELNRSDSNSSILSSSSMGPTVVPVESGFGKAHRLPLPCGQSSWSINTADEAPALFYHTL